ncbi:restriction endonuclease subunit S [Tetragenococcus halophilus]|uniref:restriction endonuclease subunit S n=1 Tax=Tetragenococcus halophilus TaxID=51669 RepID=UPI001F3B11EA|nr:restriction endonuclease subunit S [Tetragenococcus halophilus]MCF1684231.1 restriction endonuclease subunit S [Tetragenococcus halophilus]
MKAVPTWKQRKLGELVERVTRKNKNLDSTLPLTISAQDGLVDQNEYFTKIVASRNVSNYYLLKKGEFAYNKSYSNGYPLGAVKRLEKYEKGILSTLYVVFNPTYVNSDFLAKYYDSTHWYHEVYKHAAEGVRNHGLLNISPSDFFSTDLKVPKSYEEQSKIGIFINKLDNTIALHQEKLSKLQSLKKAALQFLFPKKDEIEPKARFTNFNDIWKQRKLGDVTPLRGGSAFQSSQFKKTGIPIVRISNILSDGFVGGTYAYYQEQKSDEGYVLYDGAIILAMSGATTGKVALLKDRTNKKFYQNQRVGYFTDLGIVDYSFISIVVQSFLFNVQLKTVLVAGAQPNISSKEINDFKFYFPINKKEQAKIGAFFKKLETIILLYQTKLDKLQMLKSALLQKMFI